MLSTSIMNFLSNLVIGEARHYKNMVLFPISAVIQNNFNYLTLTQALRREVLEISEVNESGSVPNLRVTNFAEIPILILDGEELKGAKQNRIVNSTILIKEKSVTMIPVSCTEQGRWSYETNYFKETGNIFSPRMREAKAENVTNSLRETGNFLSNQGEIWQNIRQLSDHLKVESRTDAMNDVFEAKKGKLSEYMESFNPEPEQVGLCVFINGKLIGMDVIADHKIYAEIHQKLVRSYALDAITGEQITDIKPSKAEVIDFFKELGNCEEEKFKSIGHGWDHRLKSNSIIGSALIDNDTIIHLACFRISERIRRMNF